MKYLRHVLKRLRCMKSNRCKKLHGDWRNTCVCTISLNIPIPRPLYPGEIYYLAHDVIYPDFGRNLLNIRTNKKRIPLTTTWVEIDPLNKYVVFSRNVYNKILIIL